MSLLRFSRRGEGEGSGGGRGEKDCEETFNPGGGREKKAEPLRVC